MDASGWMQIAVLTAIVVGLIAPLGGYMAKVFAGERTFAHPLIAPVKRLIYRAAGVDAEREQSWLVYALCFLGFHALGVLVLYGLLRLQGFLPLNPQHLSAVSPDLAFNTAVSFVTNTSWQSYGGENTLSYLSQMLGITVFSFLSAAAGIAVAIALIRGFARQRTADIGNFWVDQTRALLYVLLPLAMLGAIALSAMGVPQTLAHAANAVTIEGARQAIALGPVASQESIKLLSGDGGFGAAGSSLFAEVSTASSDGAVNSMHDSYMPLSGLVLMANVKIGEVIIGAPGSGLFSILPFAILAVFIAGLMVGRTPEYLGKKIETKEILLVVLATLAAPVAALGLTAIAVVLAPGLAGREAIGPHGLSEILYAYTSAAATNGSAFAGLSTNTPFYNVTLAIGMALGRFAVITPVLAIAGSLAAKPRAEPSPGIMPTDNGLFVGLLIGVTLIVGGLIYFPALTLAPILEQVSR